MFICSLGLWFRQHLFGFDSYATALCVKTGECGSLIYQDLAIQIFDLIPHNLLVFKLIMFLSLFFSIYFLWLLVKNFYDERTAWLSIIVLFATTPFVLFEFAKFENELFAFPFILLGCYWLLKKDLKFVVAWVASLSFWWWPGYLFLFGFKSGVMELQLFVGLSTLFLGFVFIFPYFFQKSWWLLLVGVVFLVFGLLSSHLTIFMLPIVVLGIAQFIQLARSKQWDTKNIILPCIILIIALNYALIVAVPTTNDLGLIQETIELHKKTNYPIYNDWSYGHWLQYYDYETIFRSGGEDPDYNSLKKPFIGLTMRDLTDLGCKSVKTNVSHVRKIKIWKCN